MPKVVPGPPRLAENVVVHKETLSDGTISEATVPKYRDKATIPTYDFFHYKSITGGRSHCTGLRTKPVSEPITASHI